MLSDIRAIPCAGTKFVSGRGIAIDMEHINAMVANNFSPITLLKIGIRGLVSFSILRNKGELFSITAAKVFLLIDFFSSHWGSDGESIPHISCAENINSGIDSIVVNPGGTGTGMLSGRAKRSIRIANPLSCRATLISNKVMKSPWQFCVTSCKTSEVSLFLIIDLSVSILEVLIIN